MQSETLQAYIGLASAQRLVVTAQESLAVAENLKTVTDALVQARKLPDIQRIRANFELKRTQQIVVDRQAAALASATRLQAVTGAEQPMTGSVDLASITASMIKQVDLRDTRPDISLIMAEKRRAEADIFASKQLRLPTVEAQLRRSMWSTGIEQFGARLQLSVPIWDNGSALATGRAAGFRRDEAAKRMEDLTMRAVREREAAQIEFEAARSSMNSYVGLVGEISEVMNKTQRGFELGAATLIEVLEARRTLSETLELSVAAQQRFDLAVEAILRIQGQLLVELEK